MAYMDKKRYKNPTIPSAGRQGTSQPKYDRMAPPPRAPMRAAASMRVASRGPREGAPPIPQTQRAPESETTAAGPVRRAPESQDTAARSAAVSGMMMPGTTLAPTTPAPVAAAPAPLRAPQPPLPPMHARSGGQQPGMSPGKRDSGEEETNVYAEYMKGQEEGWGTPIEEWSGPSDSPGIPEEAGYVPEPYYSDSPGIPEEAGYVPEPYYSDSPGVDASSVTPSMLAWYSAGSDSPGVDDGQQFGADPNADIVSLIEKLASGDTAAQEAALAGKKSEYLEAVDRMVREGALRRMGSGGAFARGFGTVTGKYAREMNNAELKNKEIEANKLSTAISNYINLHSIELDNETRRILADWQIDAEKKSEFHAEVNNWLKDTDTGSISTPAYGELYTLWNDLVLSGAVNPETGEAWTTADLLKQFFVKRKNKMWWNGLDAQGGWSEDSITALRNQMTGQSGSDKHAIIDAIIKDLEAKGGYEDYIEELRKLQSEAANEAADETQETTGRATKAVSNPLGAIWNWVTGDDDD